MVFKRYFKRFKRTRKGKSRYGGSAGLARKAYKGLRYLKSVLNVERKTYDKYNHQNFNPTSSGEVQILSSIAQGSDDGQRNGNSVLAKSILFQGTVKQSSEQGEATTCRCILFIDRQKCPTTGAGVTDVLKSATVDSLFNVLNRDRFTILADKRFSLPIVAEASDKPFKIFRRLHHHCKYVGTGALDLDEGHLCVLMICDGSGQYTPTWYVSSCLRYIDN